MGVVGLQGLVDGALTPVVATDPTTMKYKRSTFSPSDMASTTIHEVIEGIDGYIIQVNYIAFIVTPDSGGNAAWEYGSNDTGVLRYTDDTNQIIMTNIGLLSWLGDGSAARQSHFAPTGTITLGNVRDSGVSFTLSASITQVLTSQARAHLDLFYTLIG